MMNLGVRSLWAATIAALVLWIPSNVEALEECCDAGEKGSTQVAAESIGHVWVKGALRNKIDPVSGNRAGGEIFIAYTDEKSSLYARIYFHDQGSLDRTRDLDLKALYTKAFLTHEDGSRLEYGKTHLKLANAMCPVSGAGGVPEPRFNFHPELSVNCTAGSCSTQDGYTLNYNAMAIKVCCPTCAKAFIADAQLYAPNLGPALEALGKALSTQSFLELKGATGQ